MEGCWKEEILYLQLSSELASCLGNISYKKHCQRHNGPRWYEGDGINVHKITDQCQNSQPEEFLVVWYHMRVVMVYGKGEGRAWVAIVEVGCPVVCVERVEWWVRWGKSEIKFWGKVSNPNSDLSFLCWRSGRRPPEEELCWRKIESRPLNLRKKPCHVVSSSSRLNVFASPEASWPCLPFECSLSSHPG